MTDIDRRRFVLWSSAGLLPLPAVADAVNGPAKVRTFRSGGVPVTVEWFAAARGTGAALLLLHGAEGLSLADNYRTAARILTNSGYHVGFVHYLDRTGNKPVLFAKIRESYPVWTATIQDAVSWLALQDGVDPARLGMVGVSLGAALAMDVAAADERIKAVVAYFGPLLEGVPARAKRLPPTLILHGAKDEVDPPRREGRGVDVSHAYAWETLLKLRGTPYEIKIYPDQGHGFLGAAQLDSVVRVAGFLGRHLGPKA